MNYKICFVMFSALLLAGCLGDASTTTPNGNNQKEDPLLEYSGPKYETTAKGFDQLKLCVPDAPAGWIKAGMTKGGEIDSENVSYVEVSRSYKGPGGLLATIVLTSSKKGTNPASAAYRSLVSSESEGEAVVRTPLQNGDVEYRIVTSNPPYTTLALVISGKGHVAEVTVNTDDPETAELFITDSVRNCLIS